MHKTRVHGYTTRHGVHVKTHLRANPVRHKRHAASRRRRSTTARRRR